MSLKDNIKEQKEYLEKNLEQINTVVSAIIGYKTELKVIEENKFCNKPYIKVLDDRNLKEKCGVMAKAFKKVTIENFYMWWSEDGVFMELVFNYELNECGSNSVKFCTLNIVNDLITIV